MSNTIKRITIEGFKSIRKLEDFELRRLNVLIGANGAGKSNFVGFFRLLRELIEERLQVAVRKEGGADSYLYLGPKITKQLVGKLYFGNNGYGFTLEPTRDNRFVFADEGTLFKGDFGERWSSLGSGHAEAKLKNHKDDPGVRGARHGVEYYVFDAVSSWVVYHFHDTSETAAVRRQGSINDNISLRPNAENLAAFLYRIQQTNPRSYQSIRDVVRLAAPFFDDFKLRPVPTNTDLIQLEWSQTDSDYLFLASHLSDGTLRFICLATALLQPTPPPTVLFDEPELGLHPYALSLLGNLFLQASKNAGRQVIVSTQSAPLLNEFSPEDVIVVERTEGQSVFRRLKSDDLSEWLNDYALGELWQKNVLGGRPRSEDAPQLSGTNPGAGGKNS
jgi:predicted ATPase